MCDCINKSFFFADPTEKGYTWTLASRLGDMLFKAEAFFGSRDATFTILGTEFTSKEQPQIWFPGWPERKNIIVQLTREVSENFDQACYQMAHEVVHCLTPKPYGNSTVLEEGIACWFSDWYMKKQLNNTDWHSGDPKYKKALELVNKLFAEEQNTQIIKEFRAQGKNFSDITPEDLKSKFDGIPPDVFETLCQKFINYKV